MTWLFTIINMIKNIFLAKQQSDKSSTSISQPVQEKAEEINLYKYIQNLYLNYGIPWDEINIFGLRDISDPEQDLFNDFIGIATKGMVYLFQATTDPGVYWTKKGGMNGNGSAHICLGWHKKVYQVGLHRDREALVQSGAKITIWRDKDNDFVKGDKDTIEKGFFGVNIHRASEALDVIKIGKWSAGCMVIRKNSSFKKFMKLIKESDKYKQDNKTKFDFVLLNKDEVPI